MGGECEDLDLELAEEEVCVSRGRFGISFVYYCVIEKLVNALLQPVNPRR